MQDVSFIILLQSLEKAWFVYWLISVFIVLFFFVFVLKTLNLYTIVPSSPLPLDVDRFSHPKSRFKSRVGRFKVYSTKSKVWPDSFPFSGSGPLDETLQPISLYNRKKEKSPFLCYTDYSVGVLHPLFDENGRSYVGWEIACFLFRCGSVSEKGLGFWVTEVFIVFGFRLNLCPAGAIRGCTGHFPETELLIIPKCQIAAVIFPLFVTI